MASDAPVVTAPALRRIVIRAPFLVDMRRRLAACGGIPQWEGASGVWTMPHHTLRAVVTELAEIFGTVTVRAEVRGPGGGGG